MSSDKLRADAAKNRDKLIQAGRALFAQKGTGVTLNDVAAAAGVGVGTAYRRFANKGELIEAIYSEQIQELCAILRQCLSLADPWESLVTYLEKSLAMQVKDAAIAQIFTGSHVAGDLFDMACELISPMVNKVAENAVRAGVARPDLTGTDLIFIQISLIKIAAITRSDKEYETLYRRYLHLYLDGIRARPAEEYTPLPVPAPTTIETHRILGIPPTQCGAGNEDVL